MAKNKTTETTASVQDYIDTLKDTDRRADCKALQLVFESVTKLPAKMWGPAIVGFGAYHYKYESGHEGDAPLVGFSARTNAFVLYLGSDFPQREELLQQVGKYTTGKSCIYFKKIADIKLPVLKEMIKNSFKQQKEKYG